MQWLLRLAAVLALAAAAHADPYWIAWEGDDYPENQGWDRLIYGPPAERSLEDGSLVIDGSADIATADFYRMSMGGQLDPGPGEMFVAEWRLLVEEVSGLYDPSDPGVAVFSDDGYVVSLDFREDRVESGLEEAKVAYFSRGDYHSFKLCSGDMCSYELQIDGATAFTGVFTDVVTVSRMYWGDSVHGAASVSGWDYFQFGVVPEPHSGLLAAFALLGLGREWARSRLNVMARSRWRCEC